MLQIALAGLYITLLCYTWGHASVRLLQTALQGTKSALPPFSIVCMAGLSTLVVIGGALSLWMPLGGWALQLALLICAIAYAWFNKEVWTNAWASAGKAASRMHSFLLALLVVSLTLLLVLGAWVVVHPDTLAYHAPSIRWIAEYKAIPGLVHLHMRYGLQNYWFIACALFQFSFTHTTALTFINTSVGAWYLLFMVSRISEAGKNKDALLRNTLFLLLLAFSFLDFGMLRLTAVSASPDFVAGLYCWILFYLLLEGEDESRWPLLFFFSVMAVLIKLSCAPVLLLGGYALYILIKKGRKKAVVYLSLFTLLALGPFIARNIIASGHIIFPSPLADILQVDWKLDHRSTALVKQYITDYARIGQRAAIGGEPVTGWMPLWWSNRSVVEKFYLVVMAVTLLLGSVSFRRVVLQAPPNTRLLLFVAAAGILFWFLQAPDPRFGYAFIFPLEGVLLYRLIVAARLSKRVGKGAVFVAVALCTIGIAAYTAYRFTHFFQVKDWLQPEGIPPTATKKINRQGIWFYVPCHTCGCGSTPLPCAYDDEPFLLRGSSLEDGFKSVKPVK